jgi:transposase-like protein
MGRKRNKYPREFKIEAVKQPQSGEYTQAELARRLGVRSSDLVVWRKEIEVKKHTQDIHPVAPTQDSHL